jgi:hypothetical protein
MKSSAKTKPTPKLPKRGSVPSAKTSPSASVNPLTSRCLDIVTKHPAMPDRSIARRLGDKPFLATLKAVRSELKTLSERKQIRSVTNIYGVTLYLPSL